jgi:hypothetical protein
MWLPIKAQHTAIRSYRYGTVQHASPQRARASSQSQVKGRRQAGCIAEKAPLKADYRPKRRVRRGAGL